MSSASAVRKLIKQILPPFMADTYVRYRCKIPVYFWEGVYAHYRDVPAKGSGYDAKKIVNQVYNKTKDCLSAAQQRAGAPAYIPAEYSALPMLVSMLYKGPGPVRILDFGGGMGIAYIFLRAGVGYTPHIEYHIVERPGICEKAITLYQNDQWSIFTPNYRQALLILILSL